MRQTSRRERAAKCIPRAGAVDAVDWKCARPNLASTAPGETAAVAERRADDRGAEFPSHGFERASKAIAAG